MSAVATPPPQAPAAPPMPAASPTQQVPPPANPLGLPLRALTGGLRRFTVGEYHEMIRTGVLKEGDPVELLEGFLVNKMPQNSPHGGCVKALVRRLIPVLPAGWELSVQSPVTLADGEPEPDGAVVRTDSDRYFTRHPGPADFGIAIEVADTSVAEDRADMGRIYARAGIPVYWIVNIPERQIEVYTDPQPTAAPPAYAARKDYKPGDAVPVTLDGAVTASVPVAELLPIA